jgi:predicted acyl esterase
MIGGNTVAHWRLRALQLQLKIQLKTLQLVNSGLRNRASGTILSRCAAPSPGCNMPAGRRARRSNASSAVSVYADQMIPVGDGVSLAADVYTPKARGRYPAVVVFSAYSKELQT